MQSIRACLAALTTMALVLAFSVPAPAQDYPSRPITLLVPYAAGGGNDVMARIVAEHMSRTLGQQLVIENRGGAGGTIATRALARSAPDGYTLGIGGTGTLAVNPTLYANPGYDPRKDFAPVGLIATGALVVLVHPKVAARSIAELIALARREPGKLNYASAGVGSGIHLGTELFASMADIRFAHVPYRGTSPALNDLVGGHVDIYFSSLPSALGLIAEGKVRALAVTGARREKVLPDVPTVAEAARCRATRPCCTTASSRRRACRGRSSTSSTLRCARRSQRRRRTRCSPPPAPSRCPARPRSTPPTSTARRPSGRRSSGSRGQGELGYRITSTSLPRKWRPWLTFCASTAWASG